MYRQFKNKFFIAMGVFLIFHVMIWYFYTGKIFDTKPYYVGDLARMSYQIGSLYPRIEVRDLPNQFLDKKTWKTQSIDIVTIGDSFFNGGAGGKNPYIQDYIATKTKKNILNIQALDVKHSYIDTVNILINNGWIDKVKPKIIIIETVQREVVNRYAREHDFELSFPLKESEEKLFDRGWGAYVPDVSLINTGNYKFIYYASMYRDKDHVQKNVFKLKLVNDLFSVKEGKTLLVYADDINRLNQQTRPNLEKVNRNMNQLARKLKSHGVQLWFLVAVDKYDLYYNNLENKKYGKNHFSEEFRPLQKEYRYIDTKKILLPAIEAGEKDVFYADDTHWSNKASEIISKDITLNVK